MAAYAPVQVTRCEVFASRYTEFSGMGNRVGVVFPLSSNVVGATINQNES